MRAPRLNDESGMALAVAIFALVVIGALVAGSFYAGRLEQQSGQNTLFAAQAAEAAEAGLAAAMASITSEALDAAVAGANPTSLTTLALGSGLDATRNFSRLTTSVFLIRSTGARRNAAGTPLATRTVGSLVRLTHPDLTVAGGLSVLGKVVVSGNSTVSGNDSTPGHWTTAGVPCPPKDSTAGVHYSGTLSQGGSSVITGDPPKQLDSTLNADNLLGETSFDELKALRTLTLTSGSFSGLAPAVTGIPSQCNKTVQNNWGAPLDPLHPCFSYFPIIYRLGDLSLSGSGSGQGILLVEGDLNVQGQISFYGPVIATGSVDVRGTGSDNVKFFGGIVSADTVAVDDSRLTGNATVLYSSCAIKRALKGSALLYPVAQRGWVQLY